jgi:protein SCO1/2
MRIGFKILILTVILLTPAVIYVFLQVFGHNEFDLPTYPENSGKGDQDLNIVNFDGLYDIKGFKVDLNSFDEKIIVLEFVSILSEHKVQDYQIKRISDIFRDEESIRIIRVFVNGDSSSSIPTKLVDRPERNISVLFTGDYQMNQMIQSIIPSEVSPGSDIGFNKMFLLDNEHRIRGSYLRNDFEEIDRLILEVKILLKKDQHA